MATQPIIQPPVRIDPRIPMNMGDFAALYAANPDAAATRVHMDFPTEAKSYMSAQWRDLGMEGFPEDYFKRNRASLLQPQAPPIAISNGSGSGPLPTTWGTFANEMERTLALNSAGPLTYDPTYAGPLQKAYALSEEQRRADELAQRSAYERQFFPLRNTGTPQEILQAQLAGDRGDTKRVLQSLQGIDPETYLDAPPETRQAIKPFIPRDGFGGTPSSEGMLSALDFEVINDPEFAKIATRDPDRAAFVYRALTGRSYDQDLKSHNSTIDKRDKIGIDFVARQLQQGAQYNPNTGKWMVWNSDEQQDPLGVNPPRTVRSMVPATVEQQNWFDRYYKRVVGTGLPTQRKADRGSQMHLGGTMSRLTPDQLNLVQAEIAEATKTLGFEPPIHQQLAIIAKVVQQQPRDVPHPITRTLDAFGNFLINDARRSGERIMNDVNAVRGFFTRPSVALSTPSGLTPEEEAAILANPNLQ